MTKTESTIQQSAEELRKMVDKHLQLVCFAFPEEIVESKANVFTCSECFYKRRFKEALIEVIETLERTKKAFKSRQLEALRKKLIIVLAEDGNGLSNKSPLTNNK